MGKRYFLIKLIKIDDLPGPGSYDTNTSTLFNKSYRASGSNFDQTKRFEKIRSETEDVQDKIDYNKYCEKFHTGGVIDRQVKETVITNFKPDPCAPGPNQYSPIKISEPSSPRYKIPRTPRFKYRDNKTPGPGTYNCYKSDFKISPKPATQRLWSKFENRLNAWAENDTPGPGSYNNNWSDFCSLPLPPLNHDYHKEYKSKISDSPRSESQFIRKSQQVAEYVPGQDNQPHAPTKREHWPRTMSNITNTRIKGRNISYENDNPGVGSYNISPFRSHSPGGIFPMSKRFEGKSIFFILY